MNWKPTGSATAPKACSRCLSARSIPVHQELIKVQREIFNRVMEHLKPGVTVKELAELTLKERRTRRASNPVRRPARAAI